jgi:hypothetical protein
VRIDDLLARFESDNARDRFIGDAVLQQRYFASQVPSFLNYHPANVSRALQKRY